MSGRKPVAAPDEADLMMRLTVEKQAPAFLPYLNVASQTVRHRLIHPADTVDTQFFDDYLFEDLRFFGILALVL